MPRTRSPLAWTTTALFVVACGGGGALVAQTMLEQASVTAHRRAPAEVDLGEALLGRLSVPAGFTVSIFASGLGKPRMLDVAADGTVYATDREAGHVLALRDANGDGRADSVSTFAAGLPNVHGVDVHGSDIVLASSTTIWRSPLAQAAPQVIVSGLPDGGQHGNRMVRVGPDGRLYVTVGSSCNDCAEQNQLERATMIRYAPDGTQREVIANGLRNTIGYDWHPVAGALWSMDHGSDFRGDELPPEELNEIKPGSNYGWPICYGDRVVDPVTNASPAKVAAKPGQAEPQGTTISRDEHCRRSEPSVLTQPAHSAPMAMRFYTGTQFPAEYRNDAFVAMRGSWNRSTPSGYKVVRLRFDASGRPTGFEDFVTGFVNAEGTHAYARLVGVAIATDGALLVSDDSHGTIYRIAYTAGRG